MQTIQVTFQEKVDSPEGIDRDGYRAWLERARSVASRIGRIADQSSQATTTQAEPESGMRAEFVAWFRVEEE
jgi:hypothetical protein